MSKKSVPKGYQVQSSWSPVPLSDIPLEQLDRDYMKALEAQATKKQKEIAAAKQALRDVTKADLSEVGAPEELAQV